MNKRLSTSQLSCNVEKQGQISGQLLEHVLGPCDRRTYRSYHRLLWKYLEEKPNLAEMCQGSQLEKKRN